MNYIMMAKAMLITYAELGVQIDKFQGTDTGTILLFTVPKSSYHKDANNIEMSGKHLARRVKETLEEMGVLFLACKYKVRDEYWTESMANSAKANTYKNLVK